MNNLIIDDTTTTFPFIKKLDILNVDVTNPEILKHIVPYFGISDLITISERTWLCMANNNILPAQTPPIPKFTDIFYDTLNKQGVIYAVNMEITDVLANTDVSIHPKLSDKRLTDDGIWEVYVHKVSVIGCVSASAEIYNTVCEFPAIISNIIGNLGIKLYIEFLEKLTSAGRNKLLISLRETSNINYNWETFYSYVVGTSNVESLPTKQFIKKVPFKKQDLTIELIDTLLNEHGLSLIDILSYTNSTPDIWLAYLSKLAAGIPTKKNLSDIIHIIKNQLEKDTGLSGWIEVWYMMHLNLYSDIVTEGQKSDYKTLVRITDQTFCSIDQRVNHRRITGEDMSYLYPFTSEINYIPSELEYTEMIKTGIELTIVGIDMEKIISSTNSLQFKQTLLLGSFSDKVRFNYILSDKRLDDVELMDMLGIIHPQKIKLVNGTIADFVIGNNPSNDQETIRETVRNAYDKYLSNQYIWENMYHGGITGGVDGMFVFLESSPKELHSHDRFPFVKYFSEQNKFNEFWDKSNLRHRYTFTALLLNLPIDTREIIQKYWAVHDIETFMEMSFNNETDVIESIL